MVVFDSAAQVLVGKLARVQVPIVAAGGHSFSLSFPMTLAGFPCLRRGEAATSADARPMISGPVPRRAPETSPLWKLLRDPTHGDGDSLTFWKPPWQCRDRFARSSTRSRSVASARMNTVAWALPRPPHLRWRPSSLVAPTSPVTHHQRMDLSCEFALDQVRRLHELLNAVLLGPCERTVQHADGFARDADGRKPERRSFSRTCLSRSRSSMISSGPRASFGNSPLLLTRLPELSFRRCAPGAECAPVRPLIGHDLLHPCGGAGTGSVVSLGSFVSANIPTVYGVRFGFGRHPTPFASCRDQLLHGHERTR